MHPQKLQFRNDTYYNGLFKKKKKKTCLKIPNKSIKVIWQVD